MRLVDVQTFKLHTFYGDSIPQYAILSHTWLRESEEVTFAHLNDQSPSEWSHLPGARKVEMTCSQAIKDGYSWAWVDTCCIDKTNSSELSEAINSMFKWYKMAAVCYVYLLDIIALDSQDDFLHSRWWTRAWTLQELIAPTSVIFYDTKWSYVGSKAEKADKIAQAMNIDAETLRDPRTLYTKSVAQRMSWAARRQATRAEDLAYSLLGLFQINMTMQYGEGNEAFIRLQKEIMHTTDDLSLFAWGLAPSTLKDCFVRTKSLKETQESHKSFMIGSKEIFEESRFGMFAPHPFSFKNCMNLQFFHRHIEDSHVEEQHGNLTLRAPIVSFGKFKLPSDLSIILPTHSWIALLPCGLPDKPHMLLGLFLSSYHENGMKPNTQFRSTRKVFRDQFNAATFLVGTDLFTEAETTNIIVDSASRKSQFRTTGRAAALRRSLTVRCDSRVVLKMKLISKDEWELSEEETRTLFTKKIWSHKEITNTLALRCSTTTPKHYVYIFLQLKLSLNTVDQIAMLQSHERARSIEDIEKHWSEAPWQDAQARLYHEEEHKSIKASIETRIVFNQAVSTLTIKDDIDFGGEDSDASAGSQDSTRAIAIGDEPIDNLDFMQH